MAKYILKQEAIFALTSEAKTHNNPVKRAYTRAAAIIEQITAEDVQPVKHGRWIEHNDWIECNVCKFEVNDRYYEKRDMTSTETRYAYCPHCGAKMIKDGEQK